MRAKIEKSLIFFVSICLTLSLLGLYQEAKPVVSQNFIKWVEFNVPYSALEKAMNMDIATVDKEIHVNWIDALAYLAAKYGGNWSNYKSTDLDTFAERLSQGETLEEITQDMKYFSYFQEAYSAVLAGYLGEFQREVSDGEGGKKLITTYGLKVFSPIASGYGYSHFDDFGDSRSYGFKRQHLGHDMIGSIGTPVTAVESGYVESVGWNQYGGWRVGIRSLDGKRYYYYAHLRKDHPYHSQVQEGALVRAGDVIGYLGMTGYSTTENVNGMTIPHLHFGIQLIFDESQKESNNEIWIDPYNLVKLLEKNRVTVYKDEESGEFERRYEIMDKNFAGYSD